MLLKIFTNVLCSSSFLLQKSSQIREFFIRLPSSSFFFSIPVNKHQKSVSSQDISNNTPSFSSLFPLFLNTNFFTIICSAFIYFLNFRSTTLSLVFLLFHLSFFGFVSFLNSNTENYIFLTLFQEKKFL